MITSYKELTIDKYLEIREILNEKFGELELQVNVIACLNDMDIDAVYNLDLNKYNELVKASAFLMEKPKVDGKIPGRLIINNREFIITTNVNKLITAQYIDYQTLIVREDHEKYLPNILACFIVPKGCKYGEGYEIEEITEWIKYNLSIQDAMNICFFFRKKYLNSIRYTLTYLELRMKMMRLRARDQKVKEKMKELTVKITEYRKALQRNGDGLIW